MLKTNVKVLPGPSPIVYPFLKTGQSPSRRKYIQMHSKNPPLGLITDREAYASAVYGAIRTRAELTAKIGLSNFMNMQALRRGRPRITGRAVLWPYDAGYLSNGGISALVTVRPLVLETMGRLLYLGLGFAIGALGN